MKRSKSTKKDLKNNNSEYMWVAAGLTFILCSVGILFYTLTNTYCKVGGAICARQRCSGYIGICLGILAVALAFLNPAINRRAKVNSRNSKSATG